MFIYIWVFTLKYYVDGMINPHKAPLVAHEFSQQYGVDYVETFSLMLCLNFVCTFLIIVVNEGWPLHQLDVSNTFLFGDLIKRVFME